MKNVSGLLLIPRDGVIHDMGGNYHHGDLRAELVRVSLDLIAEQGMNGFSVAEVARRAKVSPGAPYRHFPDREGLLDGVFSRSSTATHAIWSCASPSTPRGSSSKAT